MPYFLLFFAAVIAEMPLQKFSICCITAIKSTVILNITYLLFHVAYVSKNFLLFLMNYLAKFLLLLFLNDQHNLFW